MATGRKLLQPDTAERRESSSGGVLLRGVRYKTYVDLRDEPSNRAVRMIYHDGTLEIMSPALRRHEGFSRWFGMFVYFVCTELRIPFDGARSIVLRKGGPSGKKGHGKEPDESFYLANLSKVRGKESIDLEAGDPPPDLCIEVDDLAGSRHALSVYAALAAPEVWRYRVATNRLSFHVLRSGSDVAGYDAVDRSVCLPMLTTASVLEALALKGDLPESEWAPVLQAFVRARFLPRD